ncbi:MAG TPA: outer membrane beta-barrel protein [Gemmatimonadales bacterium]|jgi:hypothetical protein|nr:outer membrane beta-barrel protein [Gemmatimonadales bacterium]HEV8599294.1 outer membrane beta-barrel protein [Gemmatimonadales bacterium]
MKRWTAAMIVGAVAALVSVSPARAQYIFAGGGANIPVSDFKDTHKTGWIVQGGVGVDIGDKGLWVEAEGWYGSNKAKSSCTTCDKVDLWSALGALGYSFSPDKNVSPYILGGAGVLGIKDGETTFGYTGALGVGFKVGSGAQIFLEGRWLAGTGDNKDAKMIPLTVGISYNFSKKM